jgi:hypothetical protein
MLSGLSLERLYRLNLFQLWRIFCVAIYLSNNPRKSSYGDLYSLVASARGSALPSWRWWDDNCKLLIIELDPAEALDF